MELVNTKSYMIKFTFCFLPPHFVPEKCGLSSDVLCRNAFAEGSQDFLLTGIHHLRWLKFSHLTSLLESLV